MRAWSLLFVFLACGIARANLISNGGFEQSCLTSHTNLYVAISPGNSCITGWTVLDDSIHYVDAGWQAAEGVRSLDLDGPPGTAGAVSAPFATTPGSQYLLTFDMAGNPNAPPETKMLQVSVAGQTNMFTFDIGSGNRMQTLDAMGWVHKQMTFVANSNSAVVEFKSMPTAGVVAGWGAALDNVAVQADVQDDAVGVPEPAAVFLIGPALAALFVIRRRAHSR